MLSSVNGNIYDFFVQKCIINGLDPDKVRKDAGVSHQVLSNWKKKDPHTVVLISSLLNQIDIQSGVLRAEFNQHRKINAGVCICTYSGIYVNVFDPKPEMFVVRDIARGLSTEYRWGGHSKTLITVAEHSERVAERLNDSEKVAGTLHDASEGYLRDLPTPIKRHIDLYNEIETLVMNCIADKFGFDWPMSAAVKAADVAELNREWEYLFFTEGFSMSQPEAEKSFLLHCSRLGL